MSSERVVEMSKWHYLLHFEILRAPGLGPVEVCIISVRTLLALIETDYKKYIVR